ncbi:MAG: alpha/beta fold hydrolase [Planctomycetes bacterium]|nr:alpha/beta fold hydrolase [Planctomycetota bacterium]
MISHIEATSGEWSVDLPAGRHRISGDLVVPEQASGLILFAHGSGSSRFSPRNRFVAEALQRRGFATLLMDLLAPEEEDRSNVFDIDLLAGRLSACVDWTETQQGVLRALPIGLFGASTGAAAALVAAARMPDRVRAVVSRGGRPDLAGIVLPQVKAPTLLIVGSRDDVVVELNQDAFAQLTCSKELRIVPGATHLFPEPGALEQVAQAAAAWFERYLVPHRANQREESTYVS